MRGTPVLVLDRSPIPLSMRLADSGHRRSSSRYAGKDMFPISNRSQGCIDRRKLAGAHFSKQLVFLVFRGFPGFAPHSQEVASIVSQCPSGYSPGATVRLSRLALSLIRPTGNSTAVIKIRCNAGVIDSNFLYRVVDRVCQLRYRRRRRRLSFRGSLGRGPEIFAERDDLHYATVLADQLSSSSLKFRPTLTMLAMPLRVI